MFTKKLVPTKLSLEQPLVCFTSDIDWAPESAIGLTHKLFSDRYIKPTYFVTHDSRFLSTLSERGEACYGIHPNFLANSSHGSNYRSVVNFFDSFPLQWRSCFRSHRYYDVTDTNMLLSESGCSYDSNNFSFLAKLDPYKHFTGLKRFSCSWEDGTYLRFRNQITFEHIKDFIDTPGITILSIHPLHMALNSPTIEFNRSFKDLYSQGDMQSLDEDVLSRHVFKGFGIRDIFEDMLDHIKHKKFPIVTLAELASDFEVVNH
jgi:hypothetical protein